jgi:hypothetical protein
VELESLGIGKAQSHRWQVMAAVPEERVRELEAELTEAGKELTSVLILRPDGVGAQRQGTTPRTAKPAAVHDCAGTPTADPLAGDTGRLKAGKSQACLRFERSVPQEAGKTEPWFRFERTGCRAICISIRAIRGDRR